MAVVQILRNINDVFNYSNSNWTDCNYILVFGDDTDWSAGNWHWDSKKSEWNKYTGTWNDFELDNNNTYVITPSSADNGAGMTYSYQSSGYSYFNRTQTLHIRFIRRSWTNSETLVFGTQMVSLVG